MKEEDPNYPGQFKNPVLRLLTHPLAQGISDCLARTEQQGALVFASGWAEGCHAPKPLPGVLPAGRAELALRSRGAGAGLGPGSRNR